MEYDVVVVGKGNAALCAALSAHEHGAKVVVLETANVEDSGGNSRFAGGSFRFAFSSVDDLRRVSELTDEEVATSDFGTNTEREFLDDLHEVTNYRTDPELSEILVSQSLDAMVWLRSKGVRFLPNFGERSVTIGGKRKFFGRLPMEVSGGGAGLVQSLDAAAKKAGIDIHYETRAVSLRYDGERVLGVHAQSKGKPVDYRGRTVILACGGFEANVEWRARYLGPGWDLAKVRGTRYNVGDGLRMALDIGAAPYGQWSRAHACEWDRYAPEYGDLSVGDQFEKHSYPFSIMINTNGQRFVDEGANFHLLTYAKYGGVLLQQPDQFAWQVFDAKVKPLLRAEYRIKFVTKVTANSLEELATRMDGMDVQAFMKTVHDYNAAVRNDVPFDRSIKDGKCTVGIDPPKSNWAQTIDTPPFEAYATTCGITFSFGGLRIDGKTSQVMSQQFRAIPGLYCCGEMVGGLFYFNYPGGAGLTSGAVFGRIAGKAAAMAKSG